MLTALLHAVMHIQALHSYFWAGTLSSPSVDLLGSIDRAPENIAAWSVRCFETVIDRDPHSFPSHEPCGFCTSFTLPLGPWFFFGLVACALGEFEMHCNFAAWGRMLCAPCPRQGVSRTPPLYIYFATAIRCCIGQLYTAKRGDP